MLTLLVSQTEDQKFVVTANRTTGWTSQPSMYIGADAGDIKSVGFKHDNETNKDGAIVAGFGLFGGWAFNNDQAGTVKMDFVATPTNETDVYQYVHQRVVNDKPPANTRQSQMEQRRYKGIRNRRTYLAQDRSSRHA